MTSEVPGRACPLRYRHGVDALAKAFERRTDTLYVVGGLYGNVEALDAVEALAQAEARSAAICFNGDFNWFNVDDDAFVEVNRRVLRHDATLGNVEAELAPGIEDAGCGCAYPESVSTDVVERSNRIHARLRTTAARHPALLAALGALPMVARYRIGGCRVGVVHGDAESLAGWRFDAGALDEPGARAWCAAAFASANVDVFASTHTCLPAMRRFDLHGNRSGWVVNNGAAGMPNFRGERHGLCVRVGLSHSPHETLHEAVVAGAHVALLPLRFDQARWHARFIAQWPPGSPAWLSYHDRICHGPEHSLDQALGRSRFPALKCRAMTT